MKNKLKRDKNKTMTNQVYEKLEDLIVFCKIEPGTILTELEISDMIGAGRTPVREALRLLANESLVSISRIGILITETSATTQLRLLEVRRSILHLLKQVTCRCPVHDTCQIVCLSAGSTYFDCLHYW